MTKNILLAFLAISISSAALAETKYATKEFQLKKDKLSSLSIVDRFEEFDYAKTASGDALVLFNQLNCTAEIEASTTMLDASLHFIKASCPEGIADVVFPNVQIVSNDCGFLCFERQKTYLRLSTKNGSTKDYQISRKSTLEGDTQKNVMVWTADENRPVTLDTIRHHSQMD